MPGVFANLERNPQLPLYDVNRHPWKMVPPGGGSVWMDST